MKIVRYLAAIALAVTAFGAVTPDAGAKSVLCPDCYIEGAVQGSGIMPDPTTIQINLNVWTYATDPLSLPEHYNVSFSGTITQGGLDQTGIFEATGTLTSNIPIPGSVMFAGPAKLSTYNVVDKPAYPLRLFSQSSSGLNFYGDVYPKPYVGVPLPTTLWKTGPYYQPLVGTAFIS